MTDKRQNPHSDKELSIGIASEERIQMFIDQVMELKERKLVSEILERELMLALIDAHQDHILEYPLIPAQQRSIVHALTIRASECETLHPYLRGVLEAFISSLTAFSRSKDLDEYERRRLLNITINHESILIKCVQGASYTYALCQDNFLEVLYRRYGDSAVHFSDEIIQEYEMDESYWRKNFEYFIGERVDKAFAAMTKHEDFILNKDGNALVLTYPLDALVHHLREGQSRIRKSQVQEEVEAVHALDSPLEQVFKTIKSFLELSVANKRLNLSAHDIEIISQITCLDPCAKTLHQIVLAGADTPPEFEVDFIQEQVLALACAVGISICLLRSGFIKGLPDMDQQSHDLIARQAEDFSIYSLDKAIYFLAEYRLAQILRERCGESISKMSITSSRVRRAPVAAIHMIVRKGLSKIKRNRLWTQDPSNTEQMLFTAKTAKELNEQLEFMIVEPELKREILRLWQRAGYKVEFNVAILLNLLAQTTTNLNYRLTEILGRFGVRLA